LKVILAIYAFNKCFSYPGKGGYDSTLAFKLPVNRCFIFLDAATYYGVIAGNYLHSSKT